MTTTGYIYDTNGGCLARIEDDTDVIDVTIRGGQKIATVRDGKFYGLQGELIGYLGPTGNFDADSVPEVFMKLLGKTGSS